MDYYVVLGIAEDADEETVRSAFRALARRYHPASISQRIGAVAIVVSESGVVRVFQAGQIEATLIPDDGCWTATTRSAA